MLLLSRLTTPPNLTPFLWQIALADQDKSVLSPKMFKAVFITADVFSLVRRIIYGAIKSKPNPEYLQVLQAAGGGLAATSNGNQSQGTMGSKFVHFPCVLQLLRC